jgi:hypothetical protein
VISKDGKSRDILGSGVISQQTLPNPDGRMTTKRKYVVVQAVQDCVISEDEALYMYRMSKQEFQCWKIEFSCDYPKK